MWTNKKFGKQKFVGGYVRDAKGERVFVLTGFETGRSITFESWQIAKQVGWKKVKK